jgi:NAD(P)-dependent dehydrogenase (short-subunit alcohol dehydrogenase family)
MKDAAMQGKVVLITGGARGIGRGMSEAFLQAGARVMIADLGGRATGWQYDLAGQDTLRRRLPSSGPWATLRPRRSTSPWQRVARRPSKPPSSGSGR